jgi:hypothetical protein
MWVIRPQLFFQYTLRPLMSTKVRYSRSAEDIPLDLVFFSAFEDSRVRTTGTMGSNGVRKLYEHSFVSTLYVGTTWQGGRPSWTVRRGATLSVLPRRQLHLYHSLQVHSTTKACLRIRLCRRSRTCITQGQPC